jgi:hypothetical protein
VGDFNSDGNLDIVVANLSPNTVDVYLGNGDGTFEAPISSNTTDGSYFVATGDFNADGKLDIAIIDGPNVSILLGKGDGTFGAPIDNASFYGAQWLAVGDFNNDHKLDVLTSGSVGGNYYAAVLLGNGDGTLQDSIDTPVEYITATVAAGDMNGDGKLDAVLGDDLDGVAVLLGNGDGSFQPPVYYSTTGLGNGEVLVSDLNLNGKMDVVVPSASHGFGGVDVFWGNGDGTLQSAQFFSTGLDTGLPAMGDLNGDGLPDIALANGEVGTITMLNTGVVSFSPSTAPLHFAGDGQQSIKLTNRGSNPLAITSIKGSGVFQVRNTCGASVRAGASCNINVTFSPQKAGTYTGLITLVDSASSKPQYIQLSGSN